MEDQTVNAILNTLIETCHDGERGFRRAAEYLQDPSAKELFLSFAAERAAMAEELRREVEQLDGLPEDGGSVSGAVHRGWMDVKGVVTGRDDESLIAAAETGEDVAVETYRKALERPLPLPIKGLVERQFRQVKTAHDRVRALKASPDPTRA